jgi:hypothetical protein
MKPKMKKFTKKDLMKFIRGYHDGIDFTKFDEHSYIINHGHYWEKHNYVKLSQWLAEANKHLVIPKDWNANDRDQMSDLRYETIDTAMWMASRTLKRK